MFSTSNFVFPLEVTAKQDMQVNDEFTQRLSMVMDSDDFLTTDITVNGQQYSNGDIVVITMSDCDEVKVGLIQTILIKGQSISFACRVYQCTRHWLQYFESQQCLEDFAIIEQSRLADYKPLIRRGTPVKFIFVLHHRVSVKYE